MTSLSVWAMSVTEPAGAAASRLRTSATTVFHGKGGEGYTYTSPEKFYADQSEIYNYYKRSWHADQPAYVQVLCEAAGMVPMLARAVRRYRVAVASSSGFDSLTVKHDLFREALGRYERFDQPTVLL